MKELVPIGVAKTLEEIGDLLSLVQQWLDKEKLRCHPQLDLFEGEKLKCEAEVMNTGQLLSCIITINGTDLILDGAFDNISFNRIEDILR